MRIQIVSDLHLEFGVMEENYQKLISAEADYLVLAGDISNAGSITDDLLHLQEDSGKKIVFVSGNHEYYGSTRKELDKELNAIKHLNKDIHVLIERDFCVGGVCFIGATGWWDGSNGNIGLTVKHGLNDFRLIYDLMDEGNLDGVTWGRKSATYLSSKMHFIRHNFPDMKICVVTHHYPHPRSLSPRFAGSPLNVCFGNRWEWMIERYQPELWIHGHTHDAFNYIVSEKDDEGLKTYEELKKTQIICNPQGYPSQSARLKAENSGQNLVDDYEYLEVSENQKYNPQLVVEL